jgi:hypothetical protein
LTVSVPAVLFTVSVVRMIHWFRASRNGMTTPAAAKRQLQLVTLVAAPIAVAYTAWALSLAPYGGPFEQAHVGLYISTTVIGCIFCLIVMPQCGPAGSHLGFARLHHLLPQQTYADLCHNRHQCRAGAGRPDARAFHQF